eukprot:Hpha_TRINITY_DN16887_c1_g2::TRINITY_DN16887_c1_g2_i1::g.153390::m.153390
MHRVSRREGVGGGERRIRGQSQRKRRTSQIKRRIGKGGNWEAGVGEIGSVDGAIRGNAKERVRRGRGETKTKKGKKGTQGCICRSPVRELLDPLTNTLHQGGLAVGDLLPQLDLDRVVGLLVEARDLEVLLGLALPEELHVELSAGGALEPPDVLDGRVLLTEKRLPDLVVREDEDRERDTGEPVHEAEAADLERNADGRVHEENTKAGLEAQTEVEHVVLHTLLHDGQLAGLADQDVGPLHDDDRDEERSLGALLGGEVLKHGETTERRAELGEVPVQLTVPGQLVRGEALAVQDGHEGVESGERLDDTDLEVREGDQLGRHQVVLCGTRATLHDVTLRVLVCERDSRHHVSAQVDAQDEHGREGQGQTDQDEADEGGDLRDVGGEGSCGGARQGRNRSSRRRAIRPHPRRFLSTS